MNLSQSLEAVKRIEGAICRPPVLRADGWRTCAVETAMARECVPGASWAMVQGGEIIWARGFGFQETGGAAVTPETLFQAASISKPVAALTALSLVQQGRLALDEDIRRYQTSWILPDNHGWQPRVSLRQLLSHSAGVTVEGFPGYPPSGPIPNLRQVLDGAEPANTPPVRVDILPGLQYRYSGGGFTILQQLIEDLTGLPFWQAARERVLQPAGMEHSTYLSPLPEALQPQAAAGHRADGQMLAGKWHLYPESAAAGLWTTPSDLARLILQLEHTLAGQEEPIISRPLLEEMLTPQVRTQQGSSLWMGLGLFLSGDPDDHYYGHGGSNEGYRCQMIARRGKMEAAVIMTNGDNGWILKEDWMNTVALEFGWTGYADRLPVAVELEAEAVARLSGVYRFKNGKQATVAESPRGLTLEIEGQVPMELRPLARDHFFLAAVNAEVRFQVELGERCRGLVFHQNGEDIPAEVLDAA